MSADAAAGLAQALRTALPLHLVGEAGTGKRSIARALHAARGGGPLLALPGGHVDAAVLNAPGRANGSLFIDRVEQLTPTAQQDLLAGLESSGLLAMPDGARVRLLSSATTDLEAALEDGRFAPELYYRLTVLTVRLAPLRDRPQDIAALAQAIAGDLAAVLGRPPVTFTPRALERLTNYLWFGNLAELEAVLARSVALSPHATLDAADLLFHPARLQAVAAVPAALPPQRHETLGTRSIDLVINELAHEFKNPLVTIKTFAQYVRRGVPRGGEEDKVARLTGEAVAQIDQTLENLLEFTRLEPPVPQSVPLSAVVNPVLEECAKALKPRGVTLEQAPAPPVVVRGDPEQLGYALHNLVRALVRDLAPASRIGVRFAAPAALTLDLPPGADPIGGRLASMLDSTDASAALPLGVAIANAVLERNGAHVALGDETPSTVTVRFTAADGDMVVAGNGTTPRSDR